MDPVLIIDAIAVAVLLAATMWLSGQTRGNDTGRTPESAEPPTESTLAHARTTVAWADGTRADWDRHVRPVLAREFQNLVGARRSRSNDRTTGELLFGTELWPLVDPRGHFTSRRERPGPGRAVLGRILYRLEQA